MAHDFVRVEHPNPQVVTLTLNRPEKRNALNIPLLEQLCDAIEGVGEEKRVVVLKGAGKVFCAGLDLKEASDPTLSSRSGALVERALKGLYHSPQVTVACIHGACVAGGAGLMSACDFALAAPATQIGYPEPKRGLVAVLVMTFLKRQLKERDARELLLLAELVRSERAKEMGLIHEVVEEEKLLERALEISEGVSLCAPGAVWKTKQLLDQLYGNPLDQDLEQAHAFHLEMRGTEEAQEGMQAFLEKRQPVWS